jgi:phosphatidylinositol-4-phosphate 3-kinase
LIPYNKATTQIPPQQYYPQPPYNQYYSQYMYFSSPVQRGIGFENIVNTLNNYSNNNIPNYYASKPPSIASSYYYSPPPSQSNSSYYSAQSTSRSLVPVQQPQQQLQPYQPASAAAALATPAPKPVLALPSSSSSTTSSTVSNERKVSIPKPPPTSVDDLINLDVPDESIHLQNILQTFDPLTIKHSIDDDASSSYYADQDPFDYIYSGGTQYSDPLYEAINRNKPVTSNNAAETYTPSRYEDVEIYNRNYGEEEGGQPPPLPPRNSTYESRNEQSFTSHGTTNKLYENIVEERKINNDSLSFYKMVKELRAKYVWDDDESNVGHIKAAQLDSKYLKVTSIKLLVYPSIECFDNRPNNFHSTSESGYQKLDGYVQPVAFTCDVNSTVVHIIMQVLAMLENEASPEKFVLKTIGLQEWLSDCNVTLSQLMYVHNCISMEKDVQLGLFPKLDKHMKVIARTRVDDNRDRDLKSENILPNDPVTSISYDSLIILLETLEMVSARARKNENV